MISVGLATRLRSAGLSWKPDCGDRFHIPDRSLDDETFLISDLSVYVTTLADGIGAINFNGTSEWAMDYILTQDVVWLPTEAQLRERLGSRFRGLYPEDGGFRCVIDDGRPFDAASASDAYGLALLAVLEER